MSCDAQGRGNLKFILETILYGLKSMDTAVIHELISLSSQNHIAKLLMVKRPMLSGDADDEKRQALEECLLVEQNCESDLSELGKNSKMLSDLEREYSQDELERAVAAKKKNADLRRQYEEIAALLTSHSMSIAEWRNKSKKMQENEKNNAHLQERLKAMSLMKNSGVVHEPNMQ